MPIGNWGTAIVFRVSEQSVLTFKDMSRTVGSDWVAHTRIGLKDQSEYLRPKLQKLTFTIELNAELGVNPRVILENLAGMAERGEVHAFVIGGRRVGANWKITDISEAWETIYNRGELTNAKLNITMEEYF